MPSQPDINKIRDDYLRKQRKDFNDLVGCGRGIIWAPGAMGAMPTALRMGSPIAWNSRHWQRLPLARDGYA
jgi:hypothetical protein